jgi:hypothetical protein
MRLTALIFVVAGFAIAVPTDHAVAAPPFRTDDPEPVEYQHWEIYGFATGTHKAGDSSGVLPGVEANYGAAPELQLHVATSLAYDRTSGNNPKFGVGETELGAKYRFIQEDDDGWRPQIGVFPEIVVPTGDDRRGLGTGHTHAFLPVWLQKGFGDWTLDGGGGYWINPGPNNKDYWFAGVLLNRRITEQFTLGTEIFHQTADTEDGVDSSGFNFGGIYDLTDSDHFLLSLGRGIQNASATNQFSYYVGYQLTF